SAAGPDHTGARGGRDDTAADRPGAGRGRQLMLTRFVRTQLIIFAIASVVGLSAMVFVYLQAPVLLGTGRITVTLQLPNTGGLYQFSNVTYRGVEVGKVTDIRPTRDGATVTMSLATSPRI